MKEEQFKIWLKDNGYQDNVIQSRVTNLRRIEEAYPDLDARIEDNTIINLMNVFIYNAHDRKCNREPLHKIQINGDLYEGTATYKNALTLYLRFYNDGKTKDATSTDSSNVKQKQPVCATEKGVLYKEKEFRTWMMQDDDKSKGTVASYICNLNFINGKWRVKKDEKNILDAISSNLYEGNTSEALNLIEAMDEVISGRMSGEETSKDEISRLYDARSALRKYRQYLQEEALEDIPDEEELDALQPETMQSAVDDGNGLPIASLLVYSYPEIETNFCFRLTTQNRMSNDKDIFYPIGIIRKLFRHSQKSGRSAALINNDYEWLKGWIKDYVSEIGVVTKQGIIPLDNCQRIVINPSDGKVSVVMNEAPDVVYSVLTETGYDAEAVAPMKASSLREIHIDHTPTMVTVLSGTKNDLPALNTLSQLIRDVARKHRINIKPANFGKISKKLFSEVERVENEMLPLIPDLKNELNLLRSKCSLKLMQANYNLTKK